MKIIIIKIRNSSSTTQYYIHVIVRLPCARYFPCHRACYFIYLSGYIRGKGNIYRKKNRYAPSVIEWVKIMDGGRTTERQTQREKHVFRGAKQRRVLPWFGQRNGEVKASHTRTAHT